MKKTLLYIDQYGEMYTAKTIKELKSKVSYSKSPRVAKMYKDTKEGDGMHVGYVIGNKWLTAYEQFIFK